MDSKMRSLAGDAADSETGMKERETFGEKGVCRRLGLALGVDFIISKAGLELPLGAGVAEADPRSNRYELAVGEGEGRDMCAATREATVTTSEVREFATAATVATSDPAMGASIASTISASLLLPSITEIAS